MELKLQRLSWLKVSELVPRKIDTVILPVGTVEAHGSDCLGTDNFIPENIAEGIAERVNALVAPTLPFGITKSLQRYAGCITLKPETFANAVTEIIGSFKQAGFKNVIVMNGHGGNNNVLKTVAHDCHRDYTVNVCVIHWWMLCAQMTEEFFGHVGGHAGTDESAMVQAIDETLVDKDAYDPKQAWYFRPGADVYPVPGTILLYKDGVGAPEYDAEKSRQYREKVIKTVGEFTELVLTRWRQQGL
ncbi:MAG: creatininase family protein [candidate division Zixibacteria bacterium]|nr:creatininase family protein [candidate division Zixibacteria bacterium]MDH3936761.1 creatininase family protein [candidate division Zixibacteria bacterium]MDH4032787.1 creatininase family protein [candidate division Zixibacteria bacterium]